MTRHAQVDFDRLMRDLMLVGFGALFGWTFAGTVGVVSGTLGIEPHATLRFLLAVLVLVFARRTYWEVLEWRWRKLPPDDRYGFSSPLWETPRTSWERPAGADAEPPHPGGGPAT
jgi:hypothetical protein